MQLTQRATYSNHVAVSLYLGCNSENSVCAQLLNDKRQTQCVIWLLHMFSLHPCSVRKAQVKKQGNKKETTKDKVQAIQTLQKIKPSWYCCVLEYLDCLWIQFSFSSFSTSIFFAHKPHQLEDQTYLEIIFACFLTHFQKEPDPDVIWTRNLLIWSQTRYRCATESISGWQLVQFRANKHSQWTTEIGSKRYVNVINLQFSLLMSYLHPEDKSLVL